MKGLLIKDFRILGQQKKLGILYIFVAVMLSLTMDPAFLVSYLPMIGVMLAFSTISYDDYDNGMPFLMSLPVNGKIYAAEKYIFSCITLLACWVIGVILQLGSMVIKKEEFNALTMVGDDLLYIAIFLLVVAVMIPIELKFGTEKGRMMIFAIFAIVMVAIVGGGKALAFIGDKIGLDYQAIMMKLQETPMLHVQLILYAAVIVLFVISAAASNAIMAKKEY